MKKFLFFSLLCLGAMACTHTQSSQQESNETDSQKTVVEVLYFHGTQRCATCVAIESNTQELINTQFADNLQNGTLVFKSVDISENEALADKYEVTWSSLVLVDFNNGQETAENLTEFAFATARNNPARFKEEVAAHITQMLHN